MKRFLYLFVGFWTVSVAHAEVTVTNVLVAQRPGTKLVDISYDVFSSDNNTVIVSLSVSNGAIAVACPSVSGDIGVVASGAGKAIVWDGGADWDGNVAWFNCTAPAVDGSYSLRFTVDGSRSYQGGSDQFVSFTVGDCLPGDRLACGTDVGVCEQGYYVCDASGQWDTSVCVGEVVAAESPEVT